MDIAKTLNPASWKAISSQHKFTDGADLAAALAALDKLADDAYAEADKALDKVAAAAQALLKNKDVAARPALLRQLKDLLADAQGAKATMKKRRAEAEQDEETAGTLESRVRSALSSLKSAPVPYRLILCECKPVDLVLITKASISAKHREQMTSLTQSKKFSKVGTVTREANLLRVDLPGASGGMAGRIQRALAQQVGQRFKVALGDDVADEQDDTPAAGAQAAASPASKVPLKAPPKAPPRPPVALKKAPLLWKGASDLITQRIGLLKTAVRQHYGDRGSAVLADIDKNLAKLDAVADRFDDRLVKALVAVHQAAPAQRAAELKKARALAAEYARFIKDEPLVDHMDANPFGVPTQIEKLVTASLAELDKALA